MENPLFSIIVPVYKVEEYLDRCVQSLINQTYRNIEILLVDDGSPDSCPQMCDAFAGRDERIHVIHKKNGGLSDARNFGIDAASGDYLIFLDSDDYIDTDACERLSKYTETHADILVADAVVEGGICHLEHIEYDGVCTGYEFLRMSVMSKKAPMAAVLYIYSRKYMTDKNLKFKVGILHEDEQFTPRAILAAESVVCTGEVFYHYIIREASITTKPDKRKNLADIYQTCLELSELYASIEDRKFRHGLYDALVSKYLNMFYLAGAHKYGKEYLHKRFVIKHSFSFKRRILSLLFVISPAAYNFAIQKLRNRK